MFTGKYAKIYCYIVLVCAIIVSVGLIAFGVKGLIDKNYILSVLIVAGLILPFIVSISMYPIFALANIDENLDLLNQRVDSISSSISPSTAKDSTKNSTTTSQNISYATLKDKATQDDKIRDAIDFINKKYDIQLDISDDLDTIKLKVSSISNNQQSLSPLVKKVLSANDVDTVISAFILHKAVHK